MVEQRSFYPFVFLCNVLTIFFKVTKRNWVSASLSSETHALSITHRELTLSPTEKYQLVLLNIWAVYIENTRWVSFDIKFTRQGFENACWHREACQAIQHAFSTPSLVNLISKDANLLFYYQFTHCFTLQLAIMTQFLIYVLIQRH